MTLKSRLLKLEKKQPVNADGSLKTWRGFIESDQILPGWPEFVEAAQAEAKAKAESQST